MYGVSGLCQDLSDFQEVREYKNVFPLWMSPSNVFFWATGSLLGRVYHDQQCCVVNMQLGQQLKPNTYK